MIGLSGGEINITPSPLTNSIGTLRRLVYKNRVNYRLIRYGYYNYKGMPLASVGMA